MDCQTASIHLRPCWVEICTRALEHNYRLLAAAASVEQAELLAIVKANAYGHGLALCAPAAVAAGARWLGVTSVEEGVAARAVCPEAEILVISGVFPGQGAAAIQHALTAVVWEPWHLDELEAAARAAGCAAGSVRIHLEVDTGMSRQGVSLAELGALLKRFGDQSLLRLDGMMTHLFAADEGDGVATREQIFEFKKAVLQVLAAELKPRWLHVGNSAAVLAGEVGAMLRALAQTAGATAMLRPGLALYGVTPELDIAPSNNAVTLSSALRPVLTWKTRVVSVRTIEPGQVVGYNGTFVATEPMRVALLAVGYADGLKRALSNQGAVLVHGMRAPIVGRISMDQAVVDVTEIAGVTAGDEVVLLGGQDAESISVEEHARIADTIPWEILTSIAARVSRVEV